MEEVLREVGVGLDMDLRGGKGGVGGGGVGGDRAGLGSGEALGGGAGRNEGGARGGGGADGERRERARGEGSGEKVFLHCTVGGVMGEKKVEQGDEDDVSFQSIPLSVSPGLCGVLAGYAVRHVEVAPRDASRARATPQTPDSSRVRRHRAMQP